MPIPVITVFDRAQACLASEHAHQKLAVHKPHLVQAPQATGITGTLEMGL